MKVLFCGLGSIGCRHLRIMQHHYNHDIYAYRTKKGQEPHNFNITEFDDLDKALAIKPDLVFITNPTHKHMEIALKCAENGLDMFIEKPLSHTLDGIVDLLRLAHQKNLFIYIGQNMRFNPVIQDLKQMIDNSELDNVLYVNVINSSYLPDWRVYQDYTKSYCTKPECGGGVIFELIHEIDYVTWLFGDINIITGRYGKISKLKSDSDDYADLLITHTNEIKSNIHLNWFSHNIERRIQIYCTDKYIDADLINNRLTIIHSGGMMKFKDYTYVRDDMFKAQLDYVFSKHKSRKHHMCNIYEIHDILKKVIMFKDNDKGIEDNEYN